MDSIFAAAFQCFNWLWSLPLSFGAVTIYVYQIVIFVFVGSVLISICKRII